MRRGHFLRPLGLRHHLGSLRDAARFSLPSLAGRDSSPALGFRRSLWRGSLRVVVVLDGTAFLCRLSSCPRLVLWPPCGRHSEGLHPRLQATRRRTFNGPTKCSVLSALSHASSSVLSIKATTPLSG